MTQTKERRLPVSFDGEALRAALVRKDVEQQQVSAMLGCDKTWLSKALARGRMDYFRLDEIAALLGQHPADFMADPREAER
jgi:transcriptional regulator with XRE-family HTH domain